MRSDDVLRELKTLLWQVLAVFDAVPRMERGKIWKSLLIAIAGALVLSGWVTLLLFAAVLALILVSRLNIALPRADERLFPVLIVVLVMFPFSFVFSHWDETTSQEIFGAQSLYERVFGPTQRSEN